MKSYRLILISLSLLLLASCSSSYAPSAPPAMYTIGGTVTNLVGVGGGLQLQDNGGDTKLINANGPFTFATSLSNGTNYTVTVSTQPSAPVQLCEVTRATGAATANITNVAVDCGHQEWTWESGMNVGNQNGIYGSPGAAAAANVPGARLSSTTWTDAAGNLWLFGGFGNDSVGTQGNLNDLWKYSGGQWAWISGSKLADQNGSYGTLRTAAAGNVPGARYSPISWIDSSGNLWLFGGQGDDSTGAKGNLNDLWKYTVNTGLWTWMGGSETGNQKGVYGTQGSAAAANVPGARYVGVGWADSSGNFWIFAGYGSDSAGTSGYLNDLWKYSVNSGQWTWMSGLITVNQNGAYGTQGTAAVGNVPGARFLGVGWSDSSGNSWLFGGFGNDSTGTAGELNDLWKFSGGQWTWIGGSKVVSPKGIYGTQGTLAPTNVPGARDSAVGWTDPNGNFWLLGGEGFDSTGTFGFLNDLWKFEP